jgi:hypothetical protein
MLRRWVRLDQRAGGERAAGVYFKVYHVSLSLHLDPCRRLSPSNLSLSTDLIAAPWPGEREIFSFGNMASRSSARLENLPLTRNVAAKDKEDSRGKSGRGSLGDKTRVGGCDSGGRGYVEREVHGSSCAVVFGRRCSLALCLCDLQYVTGLTSFAAHACRRGATVLRISHF